MEITKEKIEQQIADLEREQTSLRILNDQMVAERNVREQTFQNAVNQNQLRYQQIIGSIATLKTLLNGQQKEPTK